MILIDTSVLIRQYRSYDPYRAGLFVSLSPLICGMVRAEFMAGARKPPQISSCEILLQQFGIVVTPETVWDKAGRNQATLANANLTVPMNDTIIATVAIEWDAELWAYDQHFQAMSQFLPDLKLFIEPTP